MILSIDNYIPEEQRLKTIRIWIKLFMLGIIVSGLTAIPIKWELEKMMSLGQYLPDSLALTLQDIYQGVVHSLKHYPFLALATDWLAFGHIVIALFFIGPLKDPVKNIWIIKTGMIACLMVIPVAFIAAHYRGMPFWWGFIDANFGVMGFMPLFIVYQHILKLKEEDENTH